MGSLTTGPVTTGPATSEPVPFRRLLRAEWRKSTGTRAARWLLAAATVVTVAGAAVPLLFPHSVSQSPTDYLTWAGLGVSRLLPMVLLLSMTAEWGQRTALITFTLEPRRGRVLAAKGGAGLILSLLAGLFGLALAAVAVTAARASGRPVTGGWHPAALLGFVIFVLATGAIGLAFGSLVQHTAAAIVTYFALGGAFSLLAIPAVQSAGQWINTGQSYGWLLDGTWPGHLAQLGTSTLAWVVLPLGLGIARTLRRDIS
jgi:hypothetical protein